MSQPLPVKQLIEAFTKRHNMKGKLNEIKAMHLWAKYADPDSLPHTLKVDIQNGILFVKVDSPALKHDLRFKSEDIRQKINTELGHEVVSAIAIL